MQVHKKTLERHLQSKINISEKLTLNEKIGYACGDVASNFYWRVFDVFLFIFYTDVFGLSAATVGTMMLVTRVIDAFSDPLMGALADRTESKYGKFRPYLLWGILPLVAAGVLTFTVPDLDSTSKIIWAYLTYIFMMLAYTFINVPYGALLGVITSNSQERTVLTSFRFIGAFTGGSLVAYFTPTLVSYFGQGNETLGWQYTMGLYGVIAAILFIITFLTTQERISPPADQKTNVLQDIKDLTNNKPWLILFSLALVIMMTITLRGSTGTFYFKYYVGRPDLIGSFAMAYMLSLAAGAAATPLLTKFIDKKMLLMLLMSIVAFLSIIFYFIPAENITLIFAMQIAIGFALGPKSPLVFSMYADTADYSQYKTGRRATAMIFSAASFSQKLGGAIAGAVIGWLLASLGYVANQVQSASSEQGIVLLLTLIPGLFAALSVPLIWFYPLTDKKLGHIHAQLYCQEAEHIKGGSNCG
ncbi:MFS transporter [Colwellia sp. RSH04]|nr:MFS transporter [Colwellia sp. RSH04]